MGYVPLFDNLTTGTLHGRWPDIGLWPVMLSMADRFGRIDVTPQYIAGVTGLDVQEVVECIGRFCSPDEDSRSKTDEDEGRRLEPLEPGRKWGWKVVNHAKYREKARLLARDSDRTASGLDAERKRKKRECPPLSPEIPPSDGDGDGDGDKSKNPDRAAAQPETADKFAAIRAVYPRRAGSQRWQDAEKAYHARIREKWPHAEILEGVLRYAGFIRTSGKEGTEYVMQAATFLGKNRQFLEPWAAPPSKAQAKQDANVSASRSWLESTQ